MGEPRLSREFCGRGTELSPQQRFDEVVTMLAKAEAECGRLGEGLANLDAQPAVIEQREQCWLGAEIQRMTPLCRTAAAGIPYGRARSLI
jgi:hypothetical protein